MRKLYTLALLVRGDELLLGMKKRGFGADKWNGFGGKVEAGETLDQAAKREVAEECGIVVNSLEQVAQYDFTFEGGDLTMEVHVFKSSDFSGEPTETDEMLPGWFIFEKIPYNDMWADDRYWLPRILAGEKLKGFFHFDSEEKEIISYELFDFN